MKKPVLSLGLLLFASALAGAQQKSPSGQKSTDSAASARAVAAPDSSPTVAPGKGTAEIQRSVEQLAMAMQSVMQRIASDPALRVAAVQTAAALIATAETALDQNAGTVREVLKAAAERLRAESGTGLEPATPRQAPPKKTPSQK